VLFRSTGFRGKLVFDTSKPDGTPRKLLDVSKLDALGWCPRFSLDEGLERTYASFVRGLHAGTERIS
jgi:GDP-L-fucose synthase